MERLVARAMIHRIVAILALGLAGASACAQEADNDKRNLQGSWEAVAFEESGKEAKGPRVRLLEGMSWEFKGDEFVWRMEGEIQLKGTYRINLGKKPKEIDLVDPDRTARFVGIYEIQGESLRLRFHDEKDARPQTFTTEKAARDHFLLVLKRAKK